MEAATFQKKKTSISKGKVKRTIKNVLCRPDPVYWPNVSEEQAKVLEECLSGYKVEIPEFRKPHWQELRALPKDQRPKQPKIIRVEGFIFGLLECTRALQNKECCAVIIESSVNPRAIVQPLIEACISEKVPILCMDRLKKISSSYFGIPTSSLGVKNNFLQELTTKINDITKLHKPPQPLQKIVYNIKNNQDKMEIDENIESKTSTVTMNFSYLYRTNKKARVFNPSLEQTKSKKTFIGQDFIEFSNKPDQKINENKYHMSMILKRIGNNQNRVKRK